MSSPASSLLRVEFLGPMGAGKTTIYGRVARAGVRPRTVRPIVPAPALKRRLLQEEVRSSSILHYAFFRALCALPWLEDQLIRKRIPLRAWHALEEHSEEWSSFLDHVLYRRRPENPDPVQALLRSWRFMREVTDLALFFSRASNEVVVHDESLLQRGIGLALHDAEPERFVRRYCRLMPAPALAVHVTAERDVLAERMVTRAHNRHRHLPHLDDARRLAAVAAQSIRERGTGVLELDGTANAEDHVERVMGAVSALHEEPV